MLSGSVIHLTAPHAPDLLAEADTGVSNQDNITRLNNEGADHRLSFRVAGIRAGNWVRLLSDGVLVGQGRAQNPTAGEDVTVTVRTDGETVLEGGFHQIVAVQAAEELAEGGAESEPSEPLILLIGSVKDGTIVWTEGGVEKRVSMAATVGDAERAAVLHGVSHMAQSSVMIILTCGNASMDAGAVNGSFGGDLGSYSSSLGGSVPPGSSVPQGAPEGAGTAGSDGDPVESGGDARADSSESKSEQIGKAATGYRAARPRSEARAAGSLFQLALPSAVMGELSLPLREPDTVAVSMESRVTDVVLSFDLRGGAARHPSSAEADGLILRPPVRINDRGPSERDPWGVQIAPEVDLLRPAMKAIRPTDVPGSSDPAPVQAPQSEAPGQAGPSLEPPRADARDAGLGQDVSASWMPARTSPVAVRQAGLWRRSAEGLVDILLVTGMVYGMHHPSRREMLARPEGRRDGGRTSS